MNELTITIRNLFLLIGATLLVTTIIIIVFGTPNHYDEYKEPQDFNEQTGFQDIDEENFICDGEEFKTISIGYCKNCVTIGNDTNCECEARVKSRCFEWRFKKELR